MVSGEGSTQLDEAVRWVTEHVQERAAFKWVQFHVAGVHIEAGRDPVRQEEGSRCAVADEAGHEPSDVVLVDGNTGHRHRLPHGLNGLVDELLLKGCSQMPQLVGAIVEGAHERLAVVCRKGKQHRVECVGNSEPPRRSAKPDSSASQPGMPRRFRSDGCRR